MKLILVSALFHDDKQRIWFEITQTSQEAKVDTQDDEKEVRVRQKPYSLDC